MIDLYFSFEYWLQFYSKAPRRLNYFLTYPLDLQIYLLLLGLQEQLYMKMRHQLNRMVKRQFKGKSEISQRAFSTCTYGEVSQIFLGQNIAKSDIFGSDKTKTMFMIYFF